MTRGRRYRWVVALAIVGAALTGPVLAVDGTVVDDAGKPISGARVCYFVDKLELLCTETDGQGHFELPGSANDTLRAHAFGFNPTTFSAASQTGPVTLKRAPVLVVRLIDGASREPIQKGEVVVLYASGKEQGPFPSNAAGVRIRRGLAPGEVRLIGRSEGYAASEPRTVTLEPGVERRVELELSPRDDARSAD